MTARFGSGQDKSPSGRPQRRLSDSGPGRAAPGPSRAKRRLRKVSPKSLEAAALHYLERFASSAENLRRVLMRRVSRSARIHDIDTDEAALWIDAIIDRFSRSGLLDDARYAENLAHSLSRRGAATRAIRARLLQKGVAREDIDHAIAVSFRRDRRPRSDGGACPWIRRRRLGPHRDRASRAEFRERDLAALARAGFSYDLARRVIETEDIEELTDESRA